MKTVLLSIAGLIVLSQVAPSFYNLVGLEKGMHHCDKLICGAPVTMKDGAMY